QRRIQPHDVVALAHHRAPPRIADIPLEFHPQRTVVVCVRETAVNLRIREDKSAALAERDDGFEVGSWHNTHPGANSRRWLAARHRFHLNARTPIARAGSPYRPRPAPRGVLAARSRRPRSRTAWFATLRPRPAGPPGRRHRRPPPARR